MADETAKDARGLGEGMIPRFDAAHASPGEILHGPREPDADVLLAVAGRSTELAAEQMQQQAAEISQHLTTRQRELARREAVLNARTALDDDQQRSFRLWQREQQQELSRRAKELDDRAQALEDAAARMAAAGASADALESRALELESREQQVACRERELQALVQQLHEQKADLERQQRIRDMQWAAREHHLDELRGQLHAETDQSRTLNEQLRQKLAAQQECDALLRRYAESLAELQQWNAVLRERENWLLRDRHRWELEQERSAERIRSQRKSLADHWRSRRQALQLQQKALADRRADLTARQRALEQQQAELSRHKRAVLEQQVSSQLLQNGATTRLAPAVRTALHQSLRAYVDEQLAARQAGVRARQVVLQQLAQSLQEQQAALVAREESFRRWSIERQHDWTAREADLKIRQQELDDRRRQLEAVERDLRTWLDASCDAVLTKKASGF